MNEKKIKSKVIVYHDETRFNATTKLSGHVLLFIPTSVTVENSEPLFKSEPYEYSSLQQLYNEIMKIRTQYNDFHKLHFKKISKKGKWTKYNEVERKTLKIGVESLRNNGNTTFQNTLFCKVAVILYPIGYLDSYGGESKKERELRFHETLLRMLLKGAVHYLYSENHQVKILKIISDGNPNHRKISKNRVIKRLLVDNLRDYVYIPNSCAIIHQSSKNADFQKDSEEYINANMLQMADMLLGAIIYSYYNESKIKMPLPNINQYVSNKKEIVSQPAKELLNKIKRGKNFRNSGHFKSFSFSTAYLKDNEWHFDNIIKSFQNKTEYSETQEARKLPI